MIVHKDECPECPNGSDWRSCGKTMIVDVSTVKEKYCVYMGIIDFAGTQTRGKYVESVYKYFIIRKHKDKFSNVEKGMQKFSSLAPDLPPKLLKVPLLTFLGSIKNQRTILEFESHYASRFYTVLAMLEGSGLPNLVDGLRDAVSGLPDNLKQGSNEKDVAGQEYNNYDDYFDKCMVADLGISEEKISDTIAAIPEKFRIGDPSL